MNRSDASAQARDGRYNPGRAGGPSERTGRGTATSYSTGGGGASLNTGDPQRHADTPISGFSVARPNGARSARAGSRIEDEAFIVALEESLEKDLQIMSPLLQESSLLPQRLRPTSEPALAPQSREVHASGRDDVGLLGPAPGGPRAGPVAASASSGVAAIAASSRAAAPGPGQQTLYQFRPQRLAQMRVSPPPPPPGATDDGAGRARPPIRGAAMAGGSRAGADAARRLPLGRHASPPPPIPPPPASVASSSPQPPPSPSPSRAMQELLRMWPAPSLPGEDERRGPVASRPPAAPLSLPRSPRSPTAFFNDPEPPMPRQAAEPSRLEPQQPPQPPPSLLSQALYHAQGGSGDGGGVRRAPPAASLLRAGAGLGGGSSAAAAVLAKLPGPAAFSHLHPSSIAVGGGGGKAPATMPRFFLAGATPQPDAAHPGGDSGWIPPAASQPQRAANQQQQRPRFAAPTASTEQKQLARRAGHAAAGAAPAPSQQLREGPSASSAALSGPAAAASAGSRPASSGGATEYEPLLHLPQHASLHHNQPQQPQPQPQQPLRPRPRLRGRGSPGAAARRGPTLDAANRGAAAGRRNGAAEEAAAAADWVAGGGAEDDGSSAWDRESSAIGDHFLSEPPLGERSGMSSDADAAAASPEAYSEAASGGAGGAEGGGSFDVSGSADEPTSLQGSPPSNAAGLPAPAAAAAPPEHASLARFALSQAGAAAGDRLGTSIARWQLYQSAQAGRRGLVRLGERDERTLAVLAAAATAGQAGPQGSGEGVGRTDTAPPAAPSLPRPVFKTASLSTAAPPPVPPPAPLPPPHPADSGATDAAPAQEAPGAPLSRPRASAAPPAALATSSPGAAAPGGGGVGVVRASRLAPSGVSATEEMQAALRSLQQSQHLTVAEVQEALDALALGAAAAASAASSSAASASDPNARKGVPAAPSSLTPAREDGDAAAAPVTQREPGEPGGRAPLSESELRLAPSDASTLLPLRLAPFLQHPPMHAAALATNRASAHLPEAPRAAPDRHSLAPPSGGPADALPEESASCPRPWHDLVDAYCASQPSRRVRGICRLGRCFDAWRALADDRRRLDNVALVVTSAALRTSLQAALHGWYDLTLAVLHHRRTATRSAVQQWRKLTAAHSLERAMVGAGAAFRRFKSLNSAISRWRGAAVGETQVERSAVLLGAQFSRHRSALRATLLWRTRMLASKAARAAADAAAAQVLRCRARGMVIRWRDSAHTRALSRAFLSRNTAATCALVWRVWHARAAQWKARRMANSLAASTYTGRILRSTFASWRGSAVERQQARAAERHCRVAGQRRSLRLWAGWIARSAELSRAGAAAARLMSQNARRMSLRQWHEAARLQGVLRTATLRRRDEALRGAFERLRAYVVVAQRGRLLKSLVARARGVLPCVAPLLRWRRRARWARLQRAAAALHRSWALRRSLSHWVAAVQDARDERRRGAERDERATALSARAALARVWKRWAGEFLTARRAKAASLAAAKRHHEAALMRGAWRALQHGIARAAVSAQAAALYRLSREIVHARQALRAWRTFTFRVEAFSAKRIAAEQARAFSVLRARMAVVLEARATDAKADAFAQRHATLRALDAWSAHALVRRSARNLHRDLDARLLRNAGRRCLRRWHADAATARARAARGRDLADFHYLRASASAFGVWRAYHQQRVARRRPGHAAGFGAAGAGEAGARPRSSSRGPPDAGAMARRQTRLLGGSAVARGSTPSVAAAAVAAAAMGSPKVRARPVQVRGSSLAWQAAFQQASPPPPPSHESEPLDEQPEHAHLAAMYAPPPADLTLGGGGGVPAMHTGLQNGVLPVLAAGATPLRAPSGEPFVGPGDAPVVQGSWVNAPPPPPGAEQPARGSLAPNQRRRPLPLTQVPSRGSPGGIGRARLLAEAAQRGLAIMQPPSQSLGPASAIGQEQSSQASAAAPLTWRARPATPVQRLVGGADHLSPGDDGAFSAGGGSAVGGRGRVPVTAW